MINRHGLDQVTLEFQTTGRSECSVSLQEALLSESLDYVFCVDSLNIPLDLVPICPETDKELFRVIRRNVGTTLDDVENIKLNNDFVYTLKDKFYDVPSFVRSLNNFGRGIEQTLTLSGITDFRTLGGDPDAETPEDSVVPPLRVLTPRTIEDIRGTPPAPVALGYYDMLRFRLAVDGTLLTWMSHDFQNNFVLQFTRYGAEVLGFGNKVSAVVRRLITPDPDNLGEVLIGAPQTDYFVAVTTTAEGVKYDTASWLVTNILGANLILPGNNIRDGVLYS